MEAAIFICFESEQVIGQAKGNLNALDSFSPCRFLITLDMYIKRTLNVSLYGASTITECICLSLVQRLQMCIMGWSGRIARCFTWFSLQVDILYLAIYDSVKAQPTVVVCDEH